MRNIKLTSPFSGTFRFDGTDAILTSFICEYPEVENSDSVNFGEGSTFPAKCKASLVKLTGYIPHASPSTLREQRRRLYNIASPGIVLTLFADSLKRRVSVESVDIPERVDGDSRSFRIVLSSSQPYFHGRTEFLLSSREKIGGLHLPFRTNSLRLASFSGRQFVSPENKGSIPCDFSAEIIFSAPCSEVSLMNQEGKTVRITGDFSDGDRIILNTSHGRKSLTSNSCDVGLDSISEDSEFFSILPGKNTIFASTSSGISPAFTVTYTPQYIIA